jgi:hemerythrin
MSFRNDHLDGRHVEAKVVLSFLEGWLMSHIDEVDRIMVDHLHASGRLLSR